MSGEVASRGRRRRNVFGGGGPRVLRTVIKLNVDEMAWVKAQARAQGLTPPALFVRALLTGGAEAAAKYQRLRDELTAARRLLARVSANVNQLAAQANAGAADPSVDPVTGPQLQAALDALRGAVARIDAVAAGVSDARRQQPVGTPGQRPAGARRVAADAAGGVAGDDDGQGAGGVVRQ